MTLMLCFHAIASGVVISIVGMMIEHHRWNYAAMAFMFFLLLQVLYLKHLLTDR